MNYYQEITLLDQADVNKYHIFAGVYQIIHNVLARQLEDITHNVGISFPQYGYNEKKDLGTLGCKIRLFTQAHEELELLAVKDILDTYADYIHISSIKDVGERATHYEVYSRSRHQGYVKKATRLQAHLIKKHGIEWFDKELGSFEAVLAHCEANNKLQQNLPFIKLISRSNGAPYEIRFNRQTLDTAPNNFSFDGYGLSSKDKMSAVPAW